MSFFAIQLSLTLGTRETKIVPTLEDKGVRRLLVAVHGIGSQFRYSTVQAVAGQFAAYCGKPIIQPLGAFHPAKLITKPDSPELGAYLFEPPEDFKKDFFGFGFAEVFWADIPERAADSKNTTEESKAWAQTIVDRVRALDQSEDPTGKNNLIDYKKAGAVVEEMIDTIRILENLLFIATKAGLFEFKLGQLLTDFLGDVQIVADFKDYGGDVFKRFAQTMKHLVRRMPNLEEVHIVAHSEGTVVALKSLLMALAAKEDQDNEWVDKVKGFMTIGSPLNKHIVMWPNLWKGLKPEASRLPRRPILWRNYYDYGDPVGFDLEITRDWLKTNEWLSQSEKEQAGCFRFGDGDDCGFTRYPFPGKAHNDYWKDSVVFSHFIEEVVLGKGKRKVPQPHTIWCVAIVSRVIPYILCLALLAGGTYILYKTFVTVFKIEMLFWRMVMDVSGITCLLAGTTLLSRMPRLEKLWPGGVIGAAAFVVGAVVYLSIITPCTDTLLTPAFLPIDHGIILTCLMIGLLSAVLSKWRPKWGMIPLVTLGGMAACTVLLKLYKPMQDHSLWPLVLANAAFLYLWWLSTLLFDLVYIWHRFICSRSNRITKTLFDLRNQASERLKA